MVTPAGVKERERNPPLSLEVKKPNLPNRAKGTYRASRFYQVPAPRAVVGGGLVRRQRLAMEAEGTLSASEKASTPARRTVCESSALTTGKQHILVKMERTSTGGTRRAAQFKRAAQGPMSAAVRKQRERVRASLFPRRQAAARVKHTLQMGKARARCRAHKDLEQLESDINYFASRVTFCDYACRRLEAIRDESSEFDAKISVLNAILEDPVAIERVRALLEAGLQASVEPRAAQGEDEWDQGFSVDSV